jgi:hypothetical protein
MRKFPFVVSLPNHQRSSAETRPLAPGSAFE